MFLNVIEAIGSFISGIGIVFVAYDFGIRHHREANILNAIPVMGQEGNHGVLLENLSDAPVHKVQMRICGRWDWNDNAVTDVVLPDQRGNFKSWANILPGEWYVDGKVNNHYGKQPICGARKNKYFSQLYLSRFDHEIAEQCTPLYSDTSGTVFYVAELVYTDSMGKRWIRKAEKDNKLCLGSARRVLSRDEMLHQNVSKL